MATQSWDNFCNNQEGMCGSCPPYDANLLSNVQICAGQTANLTFDFTGGTGPYNVTWTDGTINDIQSGWIEQVMPSSTKPYTIISAFDANGCTATPGSSATVTVVPLPVAGAITGNDTVCAEKTYPYSIATVPGATSYTWTVTGGVIQSGQGTTGVTVVWNSPGARQICVRPTNTACDGNNQCLSVLVVPAAQISNVITSGATGTFVVSGGLPQTNDSTYTSVNMTLQGNPGISASLATAPYIHNETVSFAAPQAGMYTIVVTDATGCSDSETVNVVGDPDPPLPPGDVGTSGGSSTQGCTPGQLPCDPVMLPPHGTTVSPFFLGRYEVLQSEYLDLMGNNPSIRANCPNCPVENITWYDAIRYCNALSNDTTFQICYYADAALTVPFTGTTGPVYWNTEADGYRLPTEAEWEYAARAGTDLKYAGGNNPESVAWFLSNSGGQTRTAGQRAPNVWEYYDMSGNVDEWVWDAFGDYPTNDVCDPIGPAGSGPRVIRGGNYSSGTDATLSRRESALPESKSGRLGFRVCRKL